MFSDLVFAFLVESGMEKKETPQSSFASFDSFSFSWQRKNVELKRIPLCPFLVFKFQKTGGWEDKKFKLQLYLVLTVHRALGLGFVVFFFFASDIRPFKSGFVNLSPVDVCNQ